MFVLGAGGLTGQKCVEKLLEQNKSVRAIVRDPSKYEQLWPGNERLKLVAGDVTNLQLIESALAGAKSIIFAVSASTYLGASSVDKEVRRAPANLSIVFGRLCKPRRISRIWRACQRQFN